MTALSRPIGWVRGLVDVVFPRGAVVLSVLSLAYFGMGLIRNRVFANTYGAGAELDAYNAAFRIPEIALDVLVAAGLTAPFVPIFTSLRRTDEGAANTFGQTILTGAIVIMAVASTLLAIAAPWLADAFEGFDPTTRALYIDLLRINCIAQVLFAASFALGEVLVANRRFAFYALAPVLYTTGIVLGTVLFAGRFGIYATAWGAVARGRGASRDPGPRHPPDVVPDPGGQRLPDIRLPRVHPTDDPAHDQPPDRADHGDLLHDHGRVSRRGQRHRAELRERLPGPSRQPDRGGLLAGRLPHPVGRVRRWRHRDLPRGAPPEPADDRRC